MEDTSFEQRLLLLNSCHDLLEEAVALSNCRNSASILNLLLLKWQVGKISDEEFQAQLIAKMHSKDSETASLMHLLFKEHVQCVQL